MIAVSDGTLILVSAVVLGAGLLHWQGNVDDAIQASARPAIQAQASQQNTASVANRPLVNASNAPAKTQGVEVINASSATNENNPENVVIIEASSTSSINLAEEVVATASTDTIDTINVPYGNYTVQSGDSLSVIARQYGTTVSVLQDMNNIDGSLITVGQDLRYPLPVN